MKNHLKKFAKFLDDNKLILDKDHCGMPGDYEKSVTRLFQNEAYAIENLFAGRIEEFLEDDAWKMSDIVNEVHLHDKALALIKEINRELVIAAEGIDDPNPPTESERLWGEIGKIETFKYISGNAARVEKKLNLISDFYPMEVINFHNFANSTVRVFIRIKTKI